MTNTQRISKAAKLTIAGVGVLAVLGTGAVTASAATALDTPAATGLGAPAVTSTVRTASAASHGADDVPSVSATRSATAGIGYRQAVRVAKKRVPGARVTKVEREWEHGHRVWKVELRDGRAEYRVYVSVKTGKIIEFRQKHDD
ncbi:PepSY domain-containing protein [Sphaerisporangium fuscum]|uniref:PepSY domain-containing protein n=1 Tax=Sphaerisporangium fuscum TaxID=2835868 RepID=UPI001BDD7B11|nr:PepSY domain-containing protein [Sphaerisporangium fuscum]